MENEQAAPTQDAEVWPMPVLATAHITADTNDLLTRTGDRTPWGGHCARYEYGYFLSVPFEDASTVPAPPADLQAIFAWARQRAFGWVRLDADGSCEDSLATHEW